MFTIEEEEGDEEKEEEERSLVPRRRRRTEMQLRHGLFHGAGDEEVLLEEEYEGARLFNDPTRVTDCSVSASMGVMRPLVGKLDMLLLNPHGCCNSSMVKIGMRLLKEEVEEISSYLDDLAEVNDPPPTAKSWMNEARDLSYEMEDYINNLLFVQHGHFNKNKKKHTKKKFIMSHVKIPNKAKWCKQISYVTQVSENGQTRSRSFCTNIHVVLKRRPKKIEVAEMTSEFRLYIQDAIERHHRYQLHLCSIATSPTSTLSIGRMLPTPPNIDIVVDGRMNEFINSVSVSAANDAAAPHQHLKVVSVVGSGCIGKTTLTKVLYHTVGGQFDCRAFISVSKNPNIKRLFQDLFLQIHGKDPPDSSNQLGIHHDISKHLRDKRYLIIIDDLWATSVWDIIKYVFPNGNRGSTIIITTGIEDVALTCCAHQSEHVFEMKPLDDDHSRKLFYSSLFISESDCPEQFREISNKIVEMCAGLPLAIISIARLLVNQQSAISSGHLLTHIHDSLRSSLWSSSTSERTRHVLNLSYNNLPQHLKTCLLYLGMYPEGSIIWKYDLVKQWVAEGFITTREGQDIEEAAGIYFDQLVDRKFIEPMYISFSNKVVSCTVHEVVRDLIVQKSAEDNFIVVEDSTRKNMALTHKVRRLSLLFGNETYAKTPANIRKSQVRSLTFFGLFGCMPCVGDFKLLRVLNLELSGHTRGEQEPATDLTGISELLHLRYLKVASDVCIKLPNRMRGLHSLETLDTTRVTSVPCDIIHLPRLLHLTIPLDTNLLGWIDSMCSDSVTSLWSIGKLNCLQDLHLTSSSLDHLERSMEALGSLLGGHANLKTLVVAHENVSGHKNASGVIICWNGLAPPPLLERFEFSPHSCYIFAQIPMWMGQLGNLRILKIVVRELQRHGVDILRGLPVLTDLSLYVQTPLVEVVVFGKAGFSLLKYFKFSCSVPWLMFEADAMPNLWKLKLGFSAPARVDQHQYGSIIIDHLPDLQEISAKIGAAATDADAVAALRVVVRNHSSNPGIKVQLANSTFYGDKTYSRIYRLLGISPPRTVSDSSKKPLLSVAPRVVDRSIQFSQDRPLTRGESKILRTVYKGFVNLMTSLFPALAKASAPAFSQSHGNALSCNLQASAANWQPLPAESSYATHQTTTTTITTTTSSAAATTSSRTTSAAANTSSHTSFATGIFHTDVMEVITGEMPPPKPAAMGATHHLLGHEDVQGPATPTSDNGAFSSHATHTSEYKFNSSNVTNAVPGLIWRGDIPTSPNPQAADPPHVTVSVSDDVNPSRPHQRDDWDILKAIVYGGLVESITSLSVVSAAASSGAKTLDIFILGIANLIGGLPLIFHNISDLRGIQDLDGNDEQVGHYWQNLGRRSKSQLHMVMALISYIVFGLLPPVLYGLSFRESNDRENKMLAVAAASLTCIALLALGKAHVSRHRTYFKKLIYYLTIAVSSFGLSYVSGVLVTRVLVYYGIIDEGNASAPPAPPDVMFPHAVGSQTSAWSSF